MRPRAWSVADDGRRVELRPPGFAGAYRGQMLIMVMFISMLLPLALLGVVGAIKFWDFPVALRVVMGVAGSAVTAASVWFPARLLVRAWAARARIRSTRDGVLVELGTSRPRQTLWLTPRSEVRISHVAGDGGLLVRCGQICVPVATGHRPDELRSISEALRALVTAGTHAPGPLAPSSALGPTIGQSLRTAGLELVRVLRHPTPYLLVDLTSIVAAPLVASAVLAFDWQTTYPIAFAVFCVGLVLRRFDGTYVEGMRHYATEPTWPWRYLGASVAIGLSATFGLAGSLGLGKSFLLSMAVSVALHQAMLQRARSPAPVYLPRVVDFGLAATLVPLSILHEAAMFSYITDASRNLGPLALAFTPLTAVFLYAPVRLHAFVDDPEDRGNRLWFWVTVGWLTLQPILAVGTAIVG